MRKSLSRRCLHGISRALRASAPVIVMLASASLCADALAVSFGDGTRGNTVREREREDYDAVGLRAGSFWFYPSVATTVEYNDNIFADRVGKIDDMIIRVAPALRLNSDWSRHALRFQASGDLGFHTDFSTEDFEDAQLGLSGRIDITGDSAIDIDITARRDHERRDSPDDAGGISPTIFYVVSPDVTLRLRFNRLTVRLSSELDITDFKDTLAAGGVLLNEDDRDRLVWEGAAEFGYIVSPSVRGFVRGTYNIRDYDQEIDDRGRMRSSDGFGIFGGFTVELTGSLSAEGYLGYREQHFDDPAFVSIDGITGGLDFVWTPTELTTITLGAERTVRETTQESVSGVFGTDFRVSIDHELLRQLIVTVHGSIGDLDYRGSDRSDTVWRSGFRISYLVNRRVNLDLGYEYRNRSSNIDTQDFSRSTAHLRVRLQL